MVQCKRTGLRSQFCAGVGPLLPLESERCPAFLRPGLMVRANALHYALRIRTLLSTMQRVGVLRERLTHKLMAGLQEEQRRCWQARRYCQDDRAGRRGWRGGRRDHEQHQQRGGKEVRARLCDLCLAQLSSVRRGCQGEAEGRSSSRGLRQVRAPSHNRVQCAQQGDAVQCMGVAFGVHAACSMRMRYSCPISLVWQAWSATSSTSDQHAGG